MRTPDVLLVFCTSYHSTALKVAGANPLIPSRAQGTRPQNFQKFVLLWEVFRPDNVLVDALSYLYSMPKAIKTTEKYTYADYLTWPDDERWELIYGHAYEMSAAPSRRHQEVLGSLYRIVSDYSDGGSCSVYIAPFDVRLGRDLSDDLLIENVVQPDLSVFCGDDKLDDRGAIGAPDLIVEVLSPSTGTKDIKTKLLLYQKYGVREYWLVDPEAETVEVLVLDTLGKYNPGQVFEKGSQAESKIFEGLTVELGKIFGH